jgi:hypothetical protein
VAHACNPSYSGGRDQEDGGSKQSGQIVHETLSQKNPSPKRAGGVAQGEGPEFKAQYCKKKKKKKEEEKCFVLWAFTGETESEFVFGACCLFHRVQGWVQMPSFNASSPLGPGICHALRLYPCHPLTL